MMPAARNDTAMGRNSSTLKAAAQRIFSTSTARTSPRPVSRVGATTTQISAVADGLSVAGSRNIST